MKSNRYSGLSLATLAIPSYNHIPVPLFFIPQCPTIHDLSRACSKNLGAGYLDEHWRPAYRFKRRRPWALDVAHTEQDCREEKERLKTKKKKERIAERTRALQKLFPRFDASRMASRAPILLSPNSQRNIPAKLAALKSYLPEVDIDRLVRYGPDLLNYNVNKVLGPRIAKLRRIFPDFPRMVMLWPGILTHDVDTFILRKMGELSELLPGVDVVRVVSRYPTMLSFDIQGNVKPRLERLEELLSEHDIMAMIVKVPRLLGCDVAKVEQKVSSLRWLLGPDANLNKILRSNPDLMVSNVETTVAAKFRNLQELFPEADVVTMVERDSKVLFYDVENSIRVKVDCWRERVTNATELDTMIAAHPGVLSHGLDVSVSRLDFLIQANGTEIDATKLFKVVKTRRKDWLEAHGEDYRVFLERKVSGPPVLRLWPGLYFDSDAGSTSSTEGNEKRAPKDPLRATIWGDEVRVSGQDARSAEPVVDAHVKALEKKYGTIIKEAQRRFSSALRQGKLGAAPTEIDMVLYDIKKFDQQRVPRITDQPLAVRVASSVRKVGTHKEILLPTIKDKQAEFGGRKEYITIDDLVGGVQVMFEAYDDDADTLERARQSLFKRYIQVRKLAMARRLKRFNELLPELKMDRIFTDYPKIVLMDLKKVEEKINDLRGLFPGGDVSAAVSMAPQLLLYDVETCLRPRMTRLVVALTVNQLEGVLNATMVRNMVLRCPDLLLNDVRNVVVPLLEYVLRCTWDHSELGKRLYKDPTLLAVGVAPLARLQYSLEQYRQGIALLPPGRLDSSFFLPANATTSPSGGRGGDVGAEQGLARGEVDETRLLPSLVVPQILKCQMRDFIDRNPGYLSFLAQRQGLTEPNARANPEGETVASEARGDAHKGKDRASADESSQAVFLERALGARLSEMFRPIDSPYIREKLKINDGAQKNPDGQKVVLSELDLLIGDLLYFNNRMGVLFRDKMRWIPQAVDVGQEATKVAGDVEWGSRQISRLLGLSRTQDDQNASVMQAKPLVIGSRTNDTVAIDAGALMPSTAKAASQCEPGKRRATKGSDAQGAPTSNRQRARIDQAGDEEQQSQQGTWMSNALQVLKGLVDGADLLGAGAADGDSSSDIRRRGVDGEMEAVDNRGQPDVREDNLARVLDLERLLGEVSSFEGQLEGILDDRDGEMRSDVEDVGDPAGEDDPVAAQDAEVR